MSSRLQQLALIAVLGATISGFGWLYRMRLDQGEGFPMYSSLRSDPLGTRALHDSLAELRGVQVSRRFEPLSELPPHPARTIVIAGLRHERWSTFPAEEARALDGAVKAGSRVVLALRGAHDFDEREMPGTGGKEPTRREHAKQKGEENAETPMASLGLGALWDVTPEMRPLSEDVQREPGAPADLPETLLWSSDVFFQFADQSPWRVLYRCDGEPVLVERRIGRGSLVLVGDAFVLSNEALQRERSPELLAWLIGSNPTIEFDESHLGVVQQHGVAALARSYGLTGAFAAFVAAALIFVWHRTALFVPPAADSDEAALHYNQTAGLEALLRRAVAPDELVRACVAEWRNSARPVDVARADAALAAAPKDTSPVSLYNNLVRALRRR